MTRGVSVDFVLSFISSVPFQHTPKKIFHLGNWCSFCSFYNGLKMAYALWERMGYHNEEKKGSVRAFSDNGQQLGQDTVLSLFTNRRPSLPSYHHPSSMFVLEVEHCWLWSICLFLGLGFSSSLSLSFLPLIPFLVTYPALLIPHSHKHPSTPYPSFPPSLSKFYLPPAYPDTSDPKLSSCQCRGEGNRHELSHNNMWQDLQPANCRMSEQSRSLVYWYTAARIKHWNMCMLQYLLWMELIQVVATY